MIKFSITAFLQCILITMIYGQNVGIGNSNPDPSAILDVQSTTKGIMIPRLSTVQINSIASPANGLMVYNTSTNTFNYYNGSDWVQIGGNNNGTATYIADTDSDTKVQTEESANEDKIRFDIGGSEYMMLDRNEYGQATLHLMNNNHSTLIGDDAGINSNSTDNCFIGYHVGQFNTSGGSNTIVGSNAFSANVYGSFNVGLGVETLLMNTDGSSNTAVGSHALKNNISGDLNSAFGMATLENNLNGYKNSALGYWALTHNTEGYQNTATGEESLWANTTGNFNTAIGVESLVNNTTGFSNVAIGINALYSNTTIGNLVAVGDSTLFSNGLDVDEMMPDEAKYNTALGSKAQYHNTRGYKNTSIGYNSLFTNSIGYMNTAIGDFSLYANTTGSNNTAIGNNALLANETGYSNTAIGAEALHSNTTGYSNVAIGIGALYHSIDRYQLVAVGDSALYNNGLNISDPYQSLWNTAIGNKALFSNTTGADNTAVGHESLLENTEGNWNIAFGTWTLRENTLGNENSALGHHALLHNEAGSDNTAIGIGALSGNQFGSENTALGGYALEFSQLDGNTALGFRALTKVSLGDGNIGVGWNALCNLHNADLNLGVGYNVGKDLIDGSSNVLYGGNAGSLLVSGSYNTFLGYGAFGYTNNINSTAIGYQATVANGDNTVRIGNSAIVEIGGYQDWTDLSDGRFKQHVTEDIRGLDFILKLRPITYNLDIESLAEFNHENEGLDSLGNHIRQMPDAEMQKARNEKATIRYSGFIAQEVEAVAEEVGYDFSGITKPHDPQTQTYGLQYAKFTVPLVKAVQELSQQNDDLKNAITAQNVVISDLQKQMADLKELVIKLSK